MPSVKHDAPLELIRQCPIVAAEIVHAVTQTDDSDLLSGKYRADLGPTDFSEVVPVQFLADSVVIVSDAVTKKPALVIIVEPQGRDEPTKKFSWPVYVTVARRVVQCPNAFLLVICPDPVEAQKCREVIQTGHPGFDLAPAVIDPRHMPATSGGNPYLTIFAACMGTIDMAGEDGARQVLSAVTHTEASDADRRRLTAIILNLASDTARQTLEAMMKSAEWTTHPFIEKYLDQGREEGRAQEKAEDVLKLIDARGIQVTGKQRGQVTAAAGLAQLGKWFDRALTARTAADIFED